MNKSVRNRYFWLLVPLLFVALACNLSVPGGGGHQRPSTHGR